MKKILIIISILSALCLLTTYTFSASLLEKIEVYKNYSSVVVNEKKTNIQTFQYNNSQYAPIQKIAEALGAKFKWDSKTKTVSVSSVINSTENITYSRIVDSLEPMLNLDTININPDIIDGHKLEKNSNKVDTELLFEEGFIKLLPETFLDYNTNYTLKLFINNGSRILIKFKTSELPKLIPENGQKIIYVPAEPNKGFNYPYYLVLPKKINVEKNKGKKNYLFVETHNTGKVGDDLSFHIKEAYQIAEGNSASIADELGLPRIVPILVRPESSINGQLVYTHALSRNAIFLNELKKEAGTYNDVFKPMDRVDLQVANMIKHANQYLKNNGWKMEEKIFMWGFSASGDFTNRFAFLYPELVKAACFSGFPIPPISKAGGYNMIYPLGTYDFKEITGKNFSLSAYNNVAKLGYVGSADDNDPSLLDTEYEQEIVNKLLAVREYPDKWPKAKKLFQSSGGQAQANVYIGAGHETFYKGMTNDYINFFTSNRENTTPVYVKPSDPATTLTDIYSKNVIEIKNKPFSYDKTTITEAFWSGTLPQTLPKTFVDWYKKNNSEYSDDILFLSINEWDTGNSNQMYERIEKIGGELILRAQGYKDIRITITGGSMTSGDGQAQLYFGYVQNVDDVVSGVKYKIVDSTGHWTTYDDVYVVRPKK